MENRFGIKDFVFLVLILAIGVSVWLSMVQSDRQWEKVVAVEAKVDELSRRLEQIATAEGGIAAELKELRQSINRRPLAADPASGGAVAGGPAMIADAQGRDISWARPGVPIAWQPPLNFSTDPESQPGFRQGGEFVELFEAQTAKITPYLSTDVYGRRIIDRVVEQLAMYDPTTLQLEGVLAEAWQLDPEGRWLRVRLQPRATFSDGQPVTAEDVRWTVMDYVMNPLIEAERARATLDMIEDVKVIDDQTVEFVFNKAVFTNLTYTLGLYILPKHFYAQFEPAQINQSTGLLLGSGPFRLANSDPEQQWRQPEDIVLVRNDRYWGEFRPPLERLRFRTVNDELARLTAYRKDEGSMMMPTSPQFNSVIKEPDWEKGNQSLNWTNMRSGYAFIGWQCGPRAGKRLTPFADKRVRQAMTLLLDRERMIRDVWDGIGEVAKGSVNPRSPASDPALKPWPFDLERAKKLLAEAGWIDRDGDGVLENAEGQEFEFELTRASGGETAERTAKFVKDASAKAGIRCNVRVVDFSSYADILKGRDFDAITMGWGANSPESDPKQIFHSTSMREGGDNFIQWKSEVADELIDRGRTTMDFDQRMKVWHALEREMHEEQPYTFVRVVPWLRFVKKSFGNVHPYPSGLEPWEFFSIGPALPQPG